MKEIAKRIIKEGSFKGCRVVLVMNADFTHTLTLETPEGNKSLPIAGKAEGITLIRQISTGNFDYLFEPEGRNKLFLKLFAELSREWMVEENRLFIEVYGKDPDGFTAKLLTVSPESLTTKEV